MPTDQQYWEVTADRTTIYKVLASSADEAIDKMMEEEDCEEADGCTHNLKAKPWEDE